MSFQDNKHDGEFATSWSSLINGADPDVKMPCGLEQTLSYVKYEFIPFLKFLVYNLLVSSY